MSGTFQELLAELFAPLPGVVFRRMFGGTGIFRDGLMFGLVADDVLYLKADATTSPAYAAEGCGPWTYAGRNGAIAMPYWKVPERLLDEPDEFPQWAEAAHAVALRTRKKDKSPKPAAPKKKPAPKKPARKSSR